MTACTARQVTKFTRYLHFLLFSSIMAVMACSHQHENAQAASISLDLSDIVWGFGLWLTTASLIVSVIVMAVAFFGVYQYIDYRKWREKIDIETKQTATEAAEEATERMLTENSNKPPDPNDPELPTSHSER